MSLSVTSRGTGSRNTGSETSYAITPASNFSRPGLVLLFVCYDNSGTSGADPYASISDSVGNTWQVEQAGLADPGAASAGLACRLFSCTQDVGQITTGTTITISFGSTVTVARAYTLFEVTSSQGTVPIRAYITGPNGYLNFFSQTSQATTVQCGSGSRARSGMVVFGTVGIERNESITGDSDTTSGSWSTAQSSGVGTGVAGCMISTQYKIMNAENEYQYNVSWTTGSDGCFTYFVVEEPLGCTSVSAGAPTLGTPTCTSGSTDHELTGTSISAAAPTLGTPAITQDHALQVQVCTTGTVDIFENASLVTVTDPTGFAVGAWVIFKNALNIGEDLIASIAAISGNEITLNGSAGVSVTDDICVVYGVTTDDPTLGEPDVSEDHELTPDGIDAGVPVLDSPIITQDHALTADGIATAPTLGTPTLTQDHAIEADGVSSGEPTLGTPTLSEGQELTPDGIVAGAPTLESPAVSQDHTLNADGISAEPTLGTPTLTQDHAIEGDGIDTGAPTLGEPEASEDGYALTADGIATGNPLLESPELAQDHWLEASAIDTGDPTLGEPDLSESSHTLAGNAIVTGEPTISVVALAQDHVLTATGFDAGVPSLSAPDLDPGAYSLAGLGIATGAPSISTPAVSLIGLWRLLGINDPILGFRGLAGNVECCCPTCCCSPWEWDWTIAIANTGVDPTCILTAGTVVHLATNFEVIEGTCGATSIVEVLRIYDPLGNLTGIVYQELELETLDDPCGYLLHFKLRLNADILLTAIFARGSCTPLENQLLTVESGLCASDQTVRATAVV